MLAAAAFTAAAWGTAIGTAPLGQAEPTDANCTELSPNSSRVYKNCTDAKAHGRCHIPRDDPTYCPAQDRDNDGLAWEC